jgi:glycerol-3-phosphate dehydrogenase
MSPPISAAEARHTRVRWQELSAQSVDPQAAYTVRAAPDLARGQEFAIPIAREVQSVFYEENDVRVAVVDLLACESNDELHDLA